ncbi:MAG TPA: guanylate kinase [Polyangia bacterium]
MNAPVAHRGLLLVISSPSGAGKTTLARRLAGEFDLRFSVSYTTREPRKGEVHGKDYHFVSRERFAQMIEGNEFAEWAVVHGNQYGTAVATVNASLADGVDCLFDVDYQGGRQIRKLWPNESILCFILPPSMEELERRLRRRATDAEDVIERRLAMAQEELRHFGEYDYLVVNDNLDQAYSRLRAIYVAAGLTRPRNEELALRLLQEAAARAPKP